MRAVNTTRRLSAPHNTQSFGQSDVSYNGVNHCPNMDYQSSAVKQN